MGVGSGAVGRWTRVFTVDSALGFVALAALVAVDASRFELALVGVCWFLLPMVFGMAYVLLPPYVGRTFRPAWLPGLHVAAALAGTGGLVWWGVFDGAWWAGRFGLFAWTIGVLCFSVGLGRLAVPAVRERAQIRFRDGDNPQRSTRLATALLPVGLSALLGATLWLAGRASSPTGFRLAFPAAVHGMAAGFAALLVFALGVRLLRGFFHVDPPRWLEWAVLLPGALGPLLLASQPPGAPGFVAGGALETVAMLAYLALVSVVAWRTDARRVGLAGIWLGAVSGALATMIALGAVTGIVSVVGLLDLHAVLVLQGFFGLTIVGYAFQFFPVTTGRFRGASRRGALTVVALIATGLGLRIVAVTPVLAALSAIGGVLGIGGAIGYLWLVGRRLLGDASA